MTDIVLQPQNPLSLPPEELDGLGESIRALDTEYQVRIAIVEQRGYGVTWWEVVTVCVPWRDLTNAAVVAAVTTIVGAAIQWARARFKTQPDRPKYVAIRGPDGKVLKSVLVKTPDGEVEDRTPKDEGSYRPPPPDASS